MIARLSIGWQTTMADLALILFMVTVAGARGHEEQAKTGPSPAAQGEPLAVYRAQEGAPPLGDWLAEQAPDRRQHLTIFGRYREGAAEAVARRAVDLAEQAGEAGASARIVLEPGNDEDLLATLAYDRPEAAVAQSLQRSPQD